MLRTLVTLLMLGLCWFSKAEDISELYFPHTVIQDSRGFIWIGHDTGLARYDGSKLLLQSEFDPNYRPQTVYSLKVLDQYVLFSTDNGIFRLNTNDLSIVQAIESTDAVLDFELNDGIWYWITQDQLYYKVASTNEQQVAPIRKSIPLDGEGRRLITVNNSLYYMTKNRLCNQSRCIYDTFNDALNINGRIVAATNDGVLIVNPTTLGIQRRLLTGNIHRLARSNTSNALWVVNNLNKIVLVDLSDGAKLSHNYHRSNQHTIKQLFQSRDGTLWLASQLLEKLPRNFFNTVNIKGPTPTGSGHTAWFKNKLFYASSAGLFAINPSTGQSIKIERSPTYIYALLATGSELWIASYYGLYRYSSNGIQQISNSDLKISSCLKQTPQYLYICAKQGAFRLPLPYSYNSPIEKVVSSTHIADLIPGDPNYFATFKGIELPLKDSTFVIEEQGDTLALYKSNNGNIISATLNSGLFIYDKNLQKLRNLKLQLAGRCTSFIEEGDYIWIGCSSGIARIDAREYKVQEFHLSRLISAITYHNKKFYAVTSRNELISWNGTTQASEYTPHLLLGNASHNGKRLSSAGLNKELSQGYMEFSFSLDDYGAEHSYQFFLNNQFIRDFSHLNNIGINVKSGVNTVKVIAKTSKGQQKEAEVTFTIAPPVYASTQAKWFYLAILLSLFYIKHWYWRRKRTKLIRSTEKMVLKAQNLTNTKSSSYREQKMQERAHWLLNIYHHCRSWQLEQFVKPIESLNQQIDQDFMTPTSIKLSSQNLVKKASELKENQLLHQVSFDAALNHFKQAREASTTEHPRLIQIKNALNYNELHHASQEIVYLVIEQTADYCLYQYHVEFLTIRVQNKNELIEIIFDNTSRYRKDDFDAYQVKKAVHLTELIVQMLFGEIEVNDANIIVTIPTNNLKLCGERIENSGKSIKHKENHRDKKI